jgi:hypothetical protein
VGSLYHPPMRRRLFTLLSALSLLLCVGTAITWARGHWWQESAWVAAGSWEAVVGWGGGEMGGIALRDSPGSSRHSASHFGWDHHPGGNPMTEGIDSTRPGEWTKWGFGFIWDSQTIAFSIFGIVVPCWLAMLFSAVLPVLGVRRVWWRGRNPGCCRSCGYDLRATPDRCPECGTVPIASK